MLQYIVLAGGLLLTVNQAHAENAWSAPEIVSHTNAVVAIHGPDGAVQQYRYHRSIYPKPVTKGYVRPEGVVTVENHEAPRYSFSHSKMRQAYRHGHVGDEQAAHWTLLDW